MALWSGSSTVITSGWIPASAFRQPGHTPQGTAAPSFAHSIAAHRIRASVCFPDPAGPQSR